jgi:two-component system response regulator HydG
LKKLKDRTHKRITKISNKAIDMLSAYDWPGNVRELENIIEQAMVFADSDALDVKDLPSNLFTRSSASECLCQEADGSLIIRASRAGLNEILEQVEKTIILDAYHQAGKVKTETARLLKIKTSALYYKLEKYKIE